MLGEPALALLNKLAALRDGPVIELGPYIGGSTIALASGARADVITVEIGGANAGHDAIPSADIIADLRRNLDKAGLSDRVAVVDGHFRSPAALEAVERLLRGRRAGLVFVDVHPGTEIALSLYARFLAEDAFVVVDDYSSEIAREKAAQVRAFVDRAVAGGIMREIGVFGWGTWFGGLEPGGRPRLSALPTPLPCVREGGHCWHVYVGHEDAADDRSGNASPLLLFEDGRAVGPPHSLHAEIREKGGGRYSHWRGYLWFSTSDNSDPRSNGRRYIARVGGHEIDLARGPLS